MGQRHQIFVIAKIGHRYRGLAAVHHQWLYGAWALKCTSVPDPPSQAVLMLNMRPGCLRLLCAFNTPQNRRLIKQEFVKAESLDNAAWALTSREKARIPFPFITSCLSIAAAFDPHTTNLSLSDPIIMPFNLGYDEGDNNDGITIIDITEPRTKYCFLFFKDYDTYAALDTPLTAAEYLSCYYSHDKDRVADDKVNRYEEVAEDDEDMADPRMKWSDDLDGLLEQFAVKQVLDVSSLSNAWPHGFVRSVNKDNATSNDSEGNLFASSDENRKPLEKVYQIQGKPQQLAQERVSSAGPATENLPMHSHLSVVDNRVPISIITAEKFDVGEDAGPEYHSHSAHATENKLIDIDFKLGS